MSVTLQLRKSDFTAPVLCNTLILQRVHGASCRAYWLKQALVAAGWTVYYSSDGITTSTVTDTWTSSAFQAVLLQNYSSAATTGATIDGIWSCLKSPTADANGDYLHICLSPSQAVWYDPTVKGLSIASTTYCVVAKSLTNAYWLDGYYNGYLRLGMALSSSATAFSGGAPYVATNSTTVIGTLPSATGAMWTTHNLGAGTGATSSLAQTLTVLTDGNQFTVLQDTGANSTRYWWSLCAMANGGYATVEEGSYLASAYPYCSMLVGGRAWYVTAYTPSTSYDVATELGGWRAGYIKRDSGTIISGGLACPEPPGWEAIVDQPLLTGLSYTNPTCPLQAVSCTDPTHFNLGPISDMVLMGSYNMVDGSRTVDTTTQEQWHVLKDLKSYQLKWDWNDNQALRLPVIPPNSVV